MFTRQAPSLFPTLGFGVDQPTARQMVQLFANCNQALTHRAGVSLQQQRLNQQQGVLRPAGGAGPYDNAGGDATLTAPPWALGNNNYYGYDNTNNVYNHYTSGASLYQSYPDAGAFSFYNTPQLFEFGPVSSVYNSNWTTQLGDQNVFDFQVRQGDILNNYAGPTFQVAGDSYFDNSIHNHQTVTNQTVQEQSVGRSDVSDLSVGGNGPAGDPGASGPFGPAGGAGNPALAGPAGPPGVSIVLPVPAPGLGPNTSRAVVYAPDGQRSPSVKALRTVKATVRVPKSATLDPDTCEIAFEYDTVEAKVTAVPEDIFVDNITTQVVLK